jgi:molybdate transport system substrate-binding protein
MRRPLVLGALAAGLLALTACGSPSNDTPSSPDQSLTVFAAASLTGSFTELGKHFETAHPGTSVRFSFGPSSGLATQITNGAPADVFASASPKNMQAVVDGGDASGPKTFAANVMEIAVPPDNPAKIATLRDLAKPGVKVALCQAAVPCGTVAAKVFAQAGLRVTPVTEEVDVKATLTKVQLGEVDAGLVYATDVLAAGDRVRGIEIPADVNASTAYPIATMSSSKHAALAQQFVDLVLSPEGTKTLTAAGFQKP